ncbi:MAG: hypothetical protein SGILL_001583 [Bacillariaceae sp.]
MTETSIFRRVREVGAGAAPDATSVATSKDDGLVVSKQTAAPVEKMDSSTDSSTEILSVDASDLVRSEHKLLEEMPSLVSEGEGDELVSASVVTSAVRRGFEKYSPVVSPDSKQGNSSGSARKENAPKLRPRRGRIVSLDRGQQKQRGNPFAGDNSDADADGYNSQDSISPHTDGEVVHNRRAHSSSHRVVARRHSSYHDDDDSSSDDDSSYFASNLPSPKSGRSFSLSSTASAPARTAAYQIQKGASLSFSDESDDDGGGEESDLHHSSRSFNPRQHYSHPSGAPSGVHLSPMVHPNRAVADMHLYPQRITRVHSVSSLVSSASSDNNEQDQQSVANLSHRHSSSLGSITSSAASSVGSGGPELMNMAGDVTPIYGQYSASGNGQYINEYYNNNPPTATTGMPFQHNMTSTWNYPQQQQNYPFGQAAPDSDKGMRKPASAGTIPFVYSEDEAHQQTYICSAAGGAASGMPPSGFGGSRGGRGVGANGHSGLGQRNEQSLSGSPSSRAVSDSAKAIAASNGEEGDPGDGSGGNSRQVFKTYWRRWIMLAYMSALNLLSDWTCYSVAPISLLTEEAFGNIDPERLVVIFLGANAIATACEPLILARLGLRRTVILGALLLMIGSIVKSGGLPPIIPPNLDKGHAEVSLYMGFFLVGLSQPLYQCTPALLSASWFPEKERTMATGVALNANQLGIGFAFIFGTLLVAEADDIPGYFGLLSQISTIVFIGTLIQFDDAPPTPPSSSARAMRGDFTMPGFGRIRSMVRNAAHNLSGSEQRAAPKAEAPSPASSYPAEKQKSNYKRSRKNGTKRSSSARRRAPRSQQSNALTESGLAGSSAHYGSTHDAMEHIAQVKSEVAALIPFAAAPSPATSGMPPANPDGGLDDDSPEGEGGPAVPSPGMMPPGAYGYGGYPSYQYPPYWMQQQQMQQQAYFQQQYYQQQPPLPSQEQQPPPPGAGVPPMPYYPPPQMMVPYGYQQFPNNLQEFDPYYNPYNMDPYEDGAEPVVNVTPHHLDIEIRDDQVIRSLHACMTRQGFSHALASFTVSGIVINTLSTFMDYLVRLNGAPRTYTGIVGGTFQFVIMISSLIIGKQTDKTRAYYSVTIAMLVLGAFGLAECGVSLDSDRGSDLRWSLVVVAALVGPLQPVSTELGVEVAYPLSENTVLVIQQLFSNLLSAIFIPFFKSLKDIGSTKFEDGELVERPQYTFSFYLLIVLHTGVTVYFATFNGKYLRYEHELQKKEMEDAEDREKADATGAPVHPFYAKDSGSVANERQPLMQNQVV